MTQYWTNKFIISIWAATSTRFTETSNFPYYTNIKQNNPRLRAEYEELLVFYKKSDQGRISG